MSSYDPNEYGSGNASSGPNTGLILVIVLLLGLIAGGIFLVPTLYQTWTENDLDYKLKVREVQARADADAAYRKREAELAAEAKVLGERLKQVEVAPSAFRQVVKKAGPAVVNIGSWARMIDRRGEVGYVKQGEGSGVIVRIDEKKRAYVVTNNHVVRALRGGEVTGAFADRLSITLQSGRTIELDPRRGTVFGDPGVDLAVLIFDASDIDHLVAAEWGDSDAIQVGDWVVVIGSPFGLKETVTNGIISAKGRAQGDVEMIQTNAAINPGNSGGPVLDLQGRIVGIATAIRSLSGGNEGIGFAIPSNTAKDIVEQLVKPPHKIVVGYLGVSLFDLPEQDAARLRLPGAAIILGVAAGTPADEAELELYDIVTAVVVDKQRREVQSAADLRRILRGSKPGQVMTLEILRPQGQKAAPLNVSITVGELPPLQNVVRWKYRLPGL
jgi:serine protease Do